MAPSYHNKIRFLTLIATGFGLLFALPAVSEGKASLDEDWSLPYSAGPCLSFSEAQSQTAAHDPSVGVVQAQREEAQAALQQVRSDWLPQVSTYGRTAAGSAGLVSGRTDNQVGLLVSQRLYDFGQGKHRTDAARARLDAAAFDLENVHADSRYEAARIFLKVLEAGERLDAAKARERHYGDIHATRVRRLELGEMTSAEARSVEGEYALAQAGRIEEELNLATAKSRLFILTGQENMPCNDIAGISEILEVRLPDTLMTGISQALDLNPEISALQAQIRANASDYRLEKRRQLPIIEVQGAAAYIHEPAISGNILTAAEPARWQTQERIGIDISVPLWTGGRYKAALRAAQARRHGAAMSLTRAKREVESGVSLAWQRIQSGQFLMASRSKARESLEAEARAIAREFESGLRPYQDVEKAEADLQGAILQEIDAKYETLYQKLLLLSLTHRLEDPVAQD